MALINSDVIPASATGGYTIDQSLRFNDDDSAYLNRTPSTTSNRRTFTTSFWFKRGNLGGDQRMFFVGNSPPTGMFAIYFDSDRLQYGIDDGANYEYYRSDAYYRDTSAWYHLVARIDTTQATQSNRMRVYINGEQIAVSNIFGTDVGQNYDTPVNSSSFVHDIGGRNVHYGNLYFDGYIAEFNHIDGQSLDPTYFGETGDYGEWKPIRYTGTYGTNGFYLDFDGTYYNDKSGNGNNWTANNLSATDVVLDSPTNNFATFNSVDKGSGMTLSEGNLKCKATVDFHAVHSTFLLPQSGKWYFEGVTDADGDYAGDQMFGIAGHLQPISGSSPYPQEYSPTVTYHGSGGYGVSNSWNFGSFTGATARGVIVGFAINFDTSKVNIYINGTLTHSNISIPSTTQDWVIYSCQATSRFTTFNFGQDSSFGGAKTAQGNTDSNGIGDFYYTPPSGYLALCTDNLPDPDVIPSEHFNTVLYSGNSSTQSITGVGFQPDWVWVKSRNYSGYNHNVTDVVRGVGKILRTSQTDAEGTYTDTVTSFDSDGFSLGADSSGQETNKSGHNYVVWNWKGNGSGVSNTNGTITSTVSANQDAGFSIVTYTGSGGSTNTVGHGLSQPPQAVLVKGRNLTEHWCCYFEGAGASYKLRLNADIARSSDNVWQNTAPTSSKFYVASTGNPENNGSGKTYVAYCFHSVDGFSKVGSYTGNGSTDGTFVYTGFRPQFVLVKKYTGTEHWCLVDTKRDPYNVAGRRLKPNLSDSESGVGGGDRLDILSNGFKGRDGAGQYNDNGASYIYIAFAENPFKYTNAR